MRSGNLLKCLILVLMIAGTTLSAQNVALKKPLSQKDTAFLKRTVKECFGFQDQYRHTYSTTDLFATYPRPEQAASSQQIEESKKKLKGVQADLDVLVDISGMYSRLNMQKEAGDYREKAIAICKEVLEAHPDSAEMYSYLAGIYMGGLQLDESIALNRKAWSLKPSWADAPAALANIFFMTGRLDSGYNVLRVYQQNYPEKLTAYISFPLYYMYNRLNEMMKHQEEPAFLESLSSDSMLRMPVFDAYYEKHKGDPDVEYAHRVARQLMLSFVLPVRALADTSFSSETPQFKAKPEERKELLDNKAYFEKCLKGKTTAYYYYANKLLSNIHTLLDEPGQAVPYLKKAISLKPRKTWSHTSNPEEDYSNLIILHLIMHDTAAAQSVLTEKIKLCPSIEPKASDHTNMAALYILRNKLPEALQHLEKAQALDPRNADASMLHAVIEFVNSKYPEAMREINKAYGYDRNRWELYIVYGAISLCQDDPRNAWEVFKMAQSKHDKEWIQTDLLDKFFVENK